MTWTDLPPSPSRTKGPPLSAPVVVWTTAGGPTSHPRLTVSVRADLIPGLEWWKIGATAKAEVGSREHAGVLRISRGGSHLILGRSHKAARQRSRLHLSTLAGLPPARRRKTPCAFHCDAGSLQITLPLSTDWGASAKPAPAPVANRLPAPKAPRDRDPFRVPAQFRPGAHPVDAP